MNETINTLLNTSQYEQFFGEFWWLIVLALVWSIILKGIALWHAARNSQRNWFIAMLVINTVGILEIIYYFGFRKSEK